MLAIAKRICEEYAARDKALYSANVGTMSFAPVRESLHTQMQGCHMVVASMKRCLQSFSVVPNVTQSGFHDLMLNALLPNIYARFWDRCEPYILKYHGLTKADELIAISTPRQFGKTTALCMFAAAALVNVPGYVGAVYSKGKRQALLVSQKTRAFLREIPEAAARVSKENDESTVLLWPDGTTSSLLTLPGVPNASRGLAVTQILLDEAAFMNRQLILGDVVPMLGVRGRSIVVVSTPPTVRGAAFFSELFDAVLDDGTRVFAQIVLEAICATCKEAKLDTCPHMAHIRPQWKDEHRDRVQRAIYAGDMSHYRREVLGLMESPDLYCFDDKSVIHAFDRPPHTFRSPPHSIILCIDPSGGGSGSDTSWVFLSTTLGGDLVILGSNTVCMKFCHPDKEVEMIKKDLECIRSNHIFRPSLLVIVVEANHCFLRAMQIAEPLTVYKPCHVYSQDTCAPNLRRVGVWVTDTDKVRFISQLNAALTRRKVMTHSPYYGSAESRHTLVQQACDYRRILKVTNEETKVRYGGKDNGKKDDIIMALLIGYYYMCVFNVEGKHQT
jgi:hypothetical protein